MDMIKDDYDNADGMCNPTTHVPRAPLHTGYCACGERLHFPFELETGACWQCCPVDQDQD